MSDTKKRLTFPSRSVEAQKARTSAVAWLTQERNGFQSKNVAATIQKELAAVGYRVDQDLVSRSMVWLERHGYAIRVVIGKRCTEFILDSDVVVDEPPFIRAHRVREHAALAAARRVETRSDPRPAPELNGTAAPTRRPPLPRHPAPPWMRDVTDHLEAWWKEDQAAADTWARDFLEAWS